MTDGIHVPRDVADAEGIPEDLDANIVGPGRVRDSKCDDRHMRIVPSSNSLKPARCAFRSSNVQEL